MIIDVATLKKKITYVQNKSFGDLWRSNTNDPYHDYHHYVVATQDSIYNTVYFSKSCFCNKQYVTTNVAI